MNKIGQYEVGEILGEGGMGTVYQALDPRFGRQVAIKVLDSKLARQPEVVERFKNEAVIQAKLDHPHIVTVLDFVVEDDTLAIVMELIDGSSLADLLTERGARDPTWVLTILSQVLSAIGYAHRRGLIHRDLKPSNILVRDFGGKPFAWVADFGIAKILGADKMRTATGAKMGTLAYMSPEQVRNPKNVDERSDIYSLGAVLYELLTGKVPFVGESEFELMSSIVSTNAPSLPSLPEAPHLPGVVEKALAKDPHDRYLDCEEFERGLEAKEVVVTEPAKAVAQVLPRVAEPPVTESAPSVGSVPSQASPSRNSAVLWMIAAVLFGGIWMILSPKAQQTVSKTPKTKDPSPLKQGLESSFRATSPVETPRFSQLGKVEVRSNVAKDVVTIDGTPVGSTPYSGDLEAGKYLIEVTKSGCQSHREWIEVVGRGRVKISASLTCPEADARRRLSSALHREDEASTSAALEELSQAVGPGIVGDLDATAAKSWLAERDRLRLAEGEKEQAQRELIEAEKLAEKTRVFEAELLEEAIKDSRTRLLWTKNDNGSDIDWHGADAYCSSLELGGHSDWRLPSIAELEAIYQKQSHPDDCSTKWDREKSLRTRCHSRLEIDFSGPCVWSRSMRVPGRPYHLYFPNGQRDGGLLDPGGPNRALCVRTLES